MYKYTFNRQLRPNLLKGNKLWELKKNINCVVLKI